METGLQSARQGKATQPIPLFRPNELAIILVPLTAVLQDVIGLAWYRFLEWKIHAACFVVVVVADFSSK